MDERLFGRLADRLAEGAVVLATVVATRGATPRKSGSRMLVTDTAIDANSQNQIRASLQSRHHFGRTRGLIRLHCAGIGPRPGYHGRAHRRIEQYAPDIEEERHQG